MLYLNETSLRGSGVLKFNRSVYQSLAMIGQFGINILVPVLACSFLGIFLDQKLGTSYLVIILFFAGAAAGFRNIYRFSKKIFEKQDDDSPYLHKGRHRGRWQKSGQGRTEAADDENPDSKSK